MTRRHDFITPRITALAALSLCLSLLPMQGAHAQVIPGPADIGRIKPEEKERLPEHGQNNQVSIPAIVATAPIPEGAKAVHFTLKEVRIEGATAFTPEQLHDIYAPYLGRDITLDIAYLMVGAITERYRNAGYFLSLAYVPNQSITQGVIVLKVVEGYVGKVELPDDVRDHEVVQETIDRLLAQRPLKADELESFLLRLNDLPGYAFRGVLSPMEGEEGAVKLTLVPSAKDGKGTVTFDNYSSRFLGPNEASLAYAASLLPLQQTSISGLSSSPANKLKYATLDHAIAIAPELTFDVAGNVTKAQPGYTLEHFDIESRSQFLSTSLVWQWIRQRQENLAVKLTLDGRNTTSNLLHTPFTRDRMRAVRANVAYDRADGWNGYNLVNVTLSQGLSALGSSKAGDLNLSRAEARPDFVKAELSATRLQGITDNWTLQMAASGQMASGPLYSSEEFGYGGQAFGRAYDASEITGDKGVAGSLELRYGGFGDWQPVSPKPYAFYDRGEVWNDSIGQPKRESGSSAGFGVRAAASFGVSGNLGLAWPLTRQIGTPIYGQGKQGPRLLLQISKDF